jgi:thiamine biosynthesis lipoprotein
MLHGMNSALNLTVRVERADERPRATAALNACAAWLAEMERRFSRFLPESELSRLNASAGRGYYAIGEDLFAVIQLALEWAERTGGLFDPTVLGALRAAGYDQSFERIGGREVATAADGPMNARCGRWNEVRLDVARRRVSLPPGVGLDLGGIAKGWAADQLATRQLAAFSSYLIDLGGDLRVSGGPTPQTPWLIAVEDPRPLASGHQTAEPAHLAGVHLGAGAIATSGDARRWWLRDGQRLHHLIDPRTRQPAEHQTGPRLLSVSALATTTTEADVLAKVAFLRGYPEGLQGLAEGIRSAGIAILADGRVVATPNLEEYLHATATGRETH